MHNNKMANYELNKTCSLIEHDAISKSMTQLISGVTNSLNILFEAKVKLHNIVLKPSCEINYRIDYCKELLQNIDKALLDPKKELLNNSMKRKREEEQEQEQQKQQERQKKLKNITVKEKNKAVEASFEKKFEDEKEKNSILQNYVKILEEEKKKN